MRQGCSAWPEEFVRRYRQEGYWPDITLNEIASRGTAPTFSLAPSSKHKLPSDNDTTVLGNPRGGRSTSGGGGARVRSSGNTGGAALVKLPTTNKVVEPDLLEGDSGF